MKELRSDPYVIYLYNDNINTRETVKSIGVKFEETRPWTRF